MPTYRVVWEIDLDAEDALATAQEALKIMRDPDSTATFFKVNGQVINAEPEEETAERSVKNG